MESGGVDEPIVKEAVDRIQGTIIETLGLQREIELSPHLELKDLEVVRRDGSAESFSSYDLVDVVATLEEALEEKDLLEELVNQFKDRKITIESMARFLISWVGVEKIRALPRSAE